MTEDKKNYSHMITIPLSLNSEKLQSNFIGFREKVLQDPKLDLAKEAQINRNNFTFPSMLHLTIIHLDLNDREKLQ